MAYLVQLGNIHSCAEHAMSDLIICSYGRRLEMKAVAVVQSSTLQNPESSEINSKDVV